MLMLSKALPILWPMRSKWSVEEVSLKYQVQGVPLNSPPLNFLKCQIVEKMAEFQSGRPKFILSMKIWHSATFTKLCSGSFQNNLSIRLWKT